MFWKLFGLFFVVTAMGIHQILIGCGGTIPHPHLPAHSWVAQYRVRIPSLGDTAIHWQSQTRTVIEYQSVKGPP